MPWVNYASPFGTFSQWVEDSNPIVNNVNNNTPDGFTITPGPGPAQSTPSPSNLPNAISLPSNPAPATPAPITPVSQLTPVPRLPMGQIPNGIAPSTPAPSNASPVNSAPVSAAPNLPTFVPMPSDKNFKVAPSDIIQFDDSNIEIQLITNLLFEDIGAIELSDMSRSDLIDGQEVIYKPIVNLPELKRDFDPNKIISNIPMVDYFSRFLINLLSRGMYEPYFDDNGNLIIEIDKVLDDEKIEIEILSNGTIEIIGEE